LRKQKPESIFVVLKSEILIETNERFSLVGPRPVKQRSRSKNKDKWYDFHIHRRQDSLGLGQERMSRCLYRIDFTQQRKIPRKQKAREDTSFLEEGLQRVVHTITCHPTSKDWHA